MDLRGTKWAGKDCTAVAQGRNKWRSVVNTVMNLLVPYIIGNFWSSCTTNGFSRGAQLYEVTL
jgi:hypothetical protein